MGASTRSRKPTAKKASTPARRAPALAPGKGAKPAPAKRRAPGTAGVQSAGAFAPATLRSKAIEGPEQVKEILAAACPKARELAETLRRLVRKAAPDAVEKGAPGTGVITFEKKRPFCSITPGTEHVFLAFHRGSDLDDPESLLAGQGKGVRQIRVAAVHDIRGGAFERFVRQARELASR